MVKSLWDRLKKLYGNEPCTTKSTFVSENNFATYICADDKGSSNCCSCNVTKETHLFMAHEIDIENHRSKRDNADRSHRYDVFDSDTKKEEEEGEKVNISSQQYLFGNDEKEEDT